MRYKFWIFLLGWCFFGSLGLCEDIRVETFRDGQMAPYINEITDICNVIYKEYPYLYERTPEEYKCSFDLYAESNSSIICIAFDGKKVCGIAIGMPMSEYKREQYQYPFIRRGDNLACIFYIGELGVLPEYRGKGIAKQMYQALEDQVKKEKRYKAIAISQINTSLDHPSLTPALKFWEKQGFVKHPELTFQVFWKNINSNQETPHGMVYWVKPVCF